MDSRRDVGAEVEIARHEGLTVRFADTLEDTGAVREDRHSNRLTVVNEGRGKEPAAEWFGPRACLFVERAAQVAAHEGAATVDHRDRSRSTGARLSLEASAALGGEDELLPLAPFEKLGGVRASSESFAR